MALTNTQQTPQNMGESEKEENRGVPGEGKATPHSIADPSTSDTTQQPINTLWYYLGAYAPARLKPFARKPDSHFGRFVFKIDTSDSLPVIIGSSQQTRQSCRSSSSVRTARLGSIFSPI